MHPDDDVPVQLSEDSIARRRRNWNRCEQGFLKGPVPLRWLERAASLPGKALAVALAIWFRSGIESSRTDICLSGLVLKRFGVRRKAGYRALNALEKADLIRLTRTPGRRPRIEIITADSSKLPASRSEEDLS